jgi:hypothetical protein
MRIPVRRRHLLSLLLLGAIAGTPSVAAAQSTDAPVSPDQPYPSGYIAGDRRALGLGLSPYAPQTPALPGGLTIPPGGVPPPDEWTFGFRGFMSAALRASAGSRENATTDQNTMTLHTLPRIVDSYGAFEGTNNPQGSWVDLTFDYGNSVVAAHVKVTTWKPNGAVDWTAVGSQNFVDEAYLTYQVIPSGPFKLKWTTGAFRNIYGGLAQYSVGQYNAQIVGMPFGLGETLTATYDVNDTYTLHLEHGLMGRLGKVPAGVVPTLQNGGANPAYPSSWVNHLHGGLAIRGDIPLVIGLHYLRNWAQDERDQQSDYPRTYWIDLLHRPDPSMDIFGADARIMDSWLGNFAVAVSHADAHYADLLTGLNYFGTYTGEMLTKRFLGPRGGGTGQMLVAGAEYSLGWGRLLRHPEGFDGNAPDLTTSVFADVVSISSKDPDADGKKMYKFGSEVTYRFFPWLAASGRADYVVPNSKDSLESFAVISPKLIFKTAWITHEQVTLSYSHWFYGAHTHAEFADDYTRGQLDPDMYSLTFGMWF